MIKLNDTRLLYFLSAIFIAINAVCLLRFQQPFIALIPLVIIVGMMLFYSTGNLLMLMFFCAPLSISLENLGEYGVGMFLPTEPILLALTVVIVLSELLKPTFSRKLLLHPVSISIYCYLTWMLITSITSTHPAVSFKFLIAKLWFIIPVYFYGVGLFSDQKKANNAVWLYLVPLVGVVVYTLVRHAINNFEEDPAHWVMTPFYKDHTSYGALIAMFIPVAIGFLYEKDLVFWKKWFLRSIVVIMVAGLIFSYTRAAWVTLIAGIGVFIAIRFRINWKYITLMSIAGLFVVIQQYDKIIMDAEQNRIDSSDDFADHMTSATNISTDASNLERINRWNAAIAMWNERPVFGWGPGVYAFEYAPFQHPDDKTIITTYFGDLGNAHSEYLGALSEMGAIGALLFTSMVIIIFVIAVRLYYLIDDPSIKRFVLMLIIGLFTYFLHSALNNYLDTDKAAVPVWGFVAIIVALDLHYRHRISE